MNRLHISDDIYTRRESDVDDARFRQSFRPIYAACGARGVDIHPIMRGHGPGLLHRGAISTEAHCPECVRVLEERGHV